MRLAIKATLILLKLQITFTLRHSSARVYVCMPRGSELEIRRSLFLVVYFKLLCQDILFAS